MNKMVLRSKSKIQQNGNSNFHRSYYLTWLELIPLLFYQYPHNLSKPDKCSFMNLLYLKDSSQVNCEERFFR